MNKEQMNIKIAEACGWKPLGISLDMMGNPFPEDPPDYLNDLNAMHEAEKVLTQDKRTQLVNVLLCVVIKDLDRNTPMVDKLRVLYYATAAQRAEAFLRTLNLWTP